MRRHPAVLLLGPSGSGKTPLGELLERKGLWGRRCCHFDFGLELRRIVEGAGAFRALTREEVDFLRSALRSGALLEDEHFHIAEKILATFIADRNIGSDAFVVLNGLPRHVGQARDIDSIFAVEAVLLLSCTPEVASERIRANIGGDRQGRVDDDECSLRIKLGIFTRRTAPVLEHYRKLGVRIEAVEVGLDTLAGGAWDSLNGRL